MNTKNQHEIFDELTKKIDDYINSHEGEKLIEECAKEWIKSFVHIKDINLGDKNLFKVDIS